MVSIALVFGHILICESNNLGFILDKSNAKYLAVFDDSMNLNQVKSFMTKFDIKIKFLKHMKGKTSVRYITEHGNTVTDFFFRFKKSRFSGNFHQQFFSRSS